MQIFKNALSESLFSACTQDVDQRIKLNVWQSNQFFWPKTIIEGITGSTLITDVPEALTNCIAAELKQYLPKHNTLRCMYYVWQHNSGINLHDDSHVKFAGTIYLNEDWDLNDGGLFIWKDKVTEELNVISPQRNTLVVNNSLEKHLVTTVSPCAKNFRFTIQIFGID